MARELAQAISAAVFDAIETAALHHKSISLSAVEDAVEGVLARGEGNTPNDSKLNDLSGAAYLIDPASLEYLRKYFSTPPPHIHHTAPFADSGALTRMASDGYAYAVLSSSCGGETLTPSSAFNTHTITINPK